MSRFRQPMRLGVYLTISAALAFALAFACFAGLSRGADWLLMERLYTAKRLSEDASALTDAFSDTVRANQLTIQDEEAIQRWVSAQKDLILIVFGQPGQHVRPVDRPGRLRSFPEGSLSVYASSSGAELLGLLQNLEPRYLHMAQVEFSAGEDGAMQSYPIQLIYYPPYRIARIANTALALLSVGLFAVVLLLLIRRKTSYIGVLNRQLTVMAGGDLSQPMVLRGNDELTALARDMDHMRLSFIERLENESAMRKANADLVTSMSHDLRTPLTSLLGYLDILDLGRYATEEEMRRYIRSTRAKAYQIKELTDKLFEYALVYGAQDTPAQLETLDAIPLLLQFLEDGAMQLGLCGMTLEPTVPEASAMIRADPQDLRRVFDNLFANLRKYADPAVPVKADIQVDESSVRLTLRNQIAPRRAEAESSGVGLKSCERLMRRQGGALYVTQEGQTFACVLSLPRA